MSKTLTLSHGGIRVNETEVVHLVLRYFLPVILGWQVMIRTDSTAEGALYQPSGYVEVSIPACSAMAALVGSVQGGVPEVILSSGVSK